MKRLVLFAFACSMIYTSGFGQAPIKPTHWYNYPINDPVLRGLTTIRCVAAVKNLEGDGKTLIAATNYNDKGHVSIFTVSTTGDALELVWTSPKVDTTPTLGGGGSSPRNVVFGDLDGDGKKEVIFESKDNGVYIFEWDGVKGSHNFGTKASQLVGPSNLPDYPKSLGGTAYTEHLEVGDIDGDGQQELVLAYRGAATAEQKYMIISASGDWETNEPGFSGFTMEFMKPRADMVDYGLANGSAFAMIIANLNGSTTGKQAVVHAYDRKAVTILRTTAPNTFALPDVPNKQYATLNGTVDGVAYFGGIAADVDKDGCDEVYLPTSVGDSTTIGNLHMISYGKGESVSQIDMAANVTAIDMYQYSKSGLWGVSAGDMDGNGKPNIYVSAANLNAVLLSAEFQGGDKKDVKNWKTSVLYKGDSTIYQALTIRDSLGRVDTTARTVNLFFPSKFVAGLDVDNNGREDIVMGVQPWNVSTADSISIKKVTWNTTASAYDTTSYKVLNPKRYTIQVLERSATTGVIEIKNLPIVTPDDYVLGQNFPNPFNPSTQITFTLPLTKKISMKVYDILGKEVRTLVNNAEYAKGSHAITWNGLDDAGKSVASGMYIYTMTAGNIEKSMKMMLMK